MPPDPEPEDALLDAPETSLTVTFDGPLRPDAALNLPNWFLNFNGTNFAINAAVAAGNTVTLTVVDTLFPGVPPGVTYTPPPFDVIGTGGNPAQPFAVFPVHK